MHCLIFKNSAGETIEGFNTDKIVPVVGDHVEIPIIDETGNDKIVCGQVIRRHISYKNFNLPPIITVTIA